MLLAWLSNVRFSLDLYRCRNDETTPRGAAGALSVCVRVYGVVAGSAAHFAAKERSATERRNGAARKRRALVCVLCVLVLFLSRRPVRRHTRI